VAPGSSNGRRHPCFERYQAGRLMRSTPPCPASEFEEGRHPAVRLRDRPARTEWAAPRAAALRPGQGALPRQQPL